MLDFKMIDTLRINLCDAEIKRSTPLRIQPPILDYSTGRLLNDNDLFIDNSGKIIKGAKAYLNDDKFQLTINPTFISELNDENGSSILKKKKFKRLAPEFQPDLYDYNYREEEEVKGIFLQTSLPKVLNQNNFKTLSRDEIVTAIDLLQEKLKTYGIKTDLRKANLSRIDTFTNIKTDHIFYAYTNLFSLMECSRMKSIGWGEESFLWRNGQHELMIYDKIKELLLKNPDLRTGVPKNIMRIENRLLRKRKIINDLKIETVGELFDRYEDLKKFHSGVITKKIFKYNLDEIETLTEEDLRRKFIYAKKIYGSRWFHAYCFNFGVWTVSKIIDINYIQNLIEEIDEGSETQQRKKKSRIKKAMDEAKFYFGKGGVFSNEIVNFKSNVELYNEIKNKFYRQVA